MGGDGEFRSVLPSGESGQVFDTHYDDQTGLWLNGGYRTGQFRKVPGADMERLTLEPGR
jgi:acyl-homoserine lactone acylase PvdQ